MKNYYNYKIIIMSIINYFGGKRCQSDWMYKYIPKDCKTYVEVFGGSMSFFFNQNFSQFDLIVYNDINPYLVNMFSCFKNDFNKLKELLDKTDIKELTPDYHKNFRKQYIQTFQSVNKLDYNLACEFLKYFCCNFNSKMISGYSTVSDKKFKALLNKLNSDNIFYKKIKLIDEFECRNFESIINKYDSEETFFYIDPPYKVDNKTNSNAYATEKYFNELSHKELFEILDKIKGKFMLSYYMFDELKDLYKSTKYSFHTKEFLLGSSNDINNNKKKEVLILNYEHRKKITITKK